MHRLVPTIEFVKWARNYHYQSKTKYTTAQIEKDLRIKRSWMMWQFRQPQKELCVDMDETGPTLWYLNLK